MRRFKIVSFSAWKADLYDKKLEHFFIGKLYPNTVTASFICPHWPPI